MIGRSNWLSAACALAVCGGVFAEPAPETNTEDGGGWLTVHAPRVFRRSTDGKLGRSSTDVVSIDHRVSYTGLDLAMHADVLELEARIEESAQTACEQLAALSPLADLDTAACIRQATRDAMERAEALVAVAMAAYATH